jgi:hypothetical protein
MYKHPVIGVFAPTESMMLDLMSGLRKGHSYSAEELSGTGATQSLRPEIKSLPDLSKR